MRESFRAVLVFLLGLSLTLPMLGFGTGSHFDLTRSVLSEHGFGSTSIKIVQVENWLTDYYSYSPTYAEKHRKILDRLHFDNLFDDRQVQAYWSVLLRNLRLQTEKAAFNEDRFSMLVIMGVGLHAVQDFYSHSNWAELHPQKKDGPFRSETYWGSMLPQGTGPVSGVHTGKFPDDRTSGPWNSPVPPGAALHGGYHDGLNHDSPLRPRWDEAYVFAYVASHELVDALETWAEKIRPGFWNSVKQYAVNAADEARLNKDVAAARSISMWVEGKGQDGTWKGEGSGSSRFFAKFATNWVTDDSSVFVKALRDGTLKDGLAEDLYSSVNVPGVPDVRPCTLARSALLIKITNVAESRETNFFERKLTDPLGGPDFYSRIKAGGQEFWGRSIQRSRKADDPWYEIFFFEQNTATVPIVISVWDEDHTDASKDAHIDINPAAGRFDLELLFRTADSSLSGDLTGTYDSIGKTFSSEGKRPDKRRAAIRGFISQRPIN